MSKQQKAITLIALLITIIILLILAGVVINFALGNNGIFNKTKLAKEEFDNYVIKEKIAVETISNEFNNYIGDKNENSDYILGNREEVVIDKEEYDRLLKNFNPYTWELNTEIDLGNGVYGYRMQKSTFTIPGSYEFIPGSLNAGKIIDWGGSFVHDNGNTWALPASSSNMGDAEIWRSKTSNSNSYNLQFTRSGDSGTATNLDVWVKYIK